MPKLKLALLCQAAIVDQWKNLPSYINLLDDITVSELPAALIPPVTVASIWERVGDGQETLHVRLRLVKPSGKGVVVHEIEPVAMEKPKHRLNLIVGTALPETGCYHFRLDLRVKGRWRNVADLPLNVKLSELPETESPEPAVPQRQKPPKRADQRRAKRRKGEGG